MNEKLKSRLVGLDGALLPRHGICPPLRCCAPLEGSPIHVCGELATSKREGVRWIDDRYFCEAHAVETDVDLRGELAIRVVRVKCDVLIAGTNIQAPVAQTEAVGRLEAAALAIGALLDVLSVTSTLALYARPTAPGRLNRGPEGTDES